MTWLPTLPPHPCSYPWCCSALTVWRRKRGPTLETNTARPGDHLDALSQPDHPSFPSSHQLFTVAQSQLRLVDPLNGGPGARSNSPRLYHKLLARLGLTSSLLSPLHSTSLRRCCSTGHSRDGRKGHERVDLASSWLRADNGGQ